MAKITRYKGDTVTALSFALAVVTVVAFGLWLYPKVKAQPETVGNASKFEASLNLNIKVETPSSKVATSQPLNASSNGLDETEPAGATETNEKLKEVKWQEIAPIVITASLGLLAWLAWRHRAKLFKTTGGVAGLAGRLGVARCAKAFVALLTYLLILLTVRTLFPGVWLWWQELGDFFFLVTTIGIPLFLVGYLFTDWVGRTALALLLLLLAIYAFLPQVKDGYAGFQVWWKQRAVTTASKSDASFDDTIEVRAPVGSWSGWVPIPATEFTIHPQGKVRFRTMADPDSPFDDAPGMTVHWGERLSVRKRTFQVQSREDHEVNVIVRLPKRSK